MASDRFASAVTSNAMMAVVTTGNGGYDKLVYREVPVPEPGPGEVLLQVLAAGMNNTEVNTRVGWYSASVTGSTEHMADRQARDGAPKSDGGWNRATPFPFIQGTDCCGRVVKTGHQVNGALLGERVLVRACMRPDGFESMNTLWMGSDFDGAFAQFVKVPAEEVFPIACDWTDTELATIPCSYGTAENMLHRTGVAQGERVLITGASGGVGSAAVQLAKRRGCHVLAVTGPGKAERIRSIGADRVIHRDDDIVAALGREAVDVVVDNVVGQGFPVMLEILKRGGRYTSSGAIAGPLVTLDIRDMYLKDITLVGCTAWDEPVFPNLVSYIEAGDIRPLVARTYPLGQIADAQKQFMKKQHFGNFVLVPPQP